MPDIAITAATASDIGAIKALLTSNSLPTQGIDEHWRTFVIARDHGRIVACGGAEAYQVAALSRSIAVDPDYRSHGLCPSTTTAEDYFRKRACKTIDRDEGHPQLLQSREFQDACPSTATCMRLVMLA